MLLICLIAVDGDRILDEFGCQLGPLHPLHASQGRRCVLRSIRSDLGTGADAIH